MQVVNVSPPGQEPNMADATEDMRLFDAKLRNKNGEHPACFAAACLLHALDLSGIECAERHEVTRAFVASGPQGLHCTCTRRALSGGTNPIASRLEADLVGGVYFPTHSISVHNTSNIFHLTLPFATAQVDPYMLMRAASIT